MIRSSRQAAGLHGLITRNVESLMRHKGLRTQRDLAKILGWGEDRLSRRFSKGWLLDDLSILAEKLGIEADELVSQRPSWVADYRAEHDDDPVKVDAQGVPRQQVALETVDSTVGATVRALRSAYQVDATVLARHVGISRQALYNRLNGQAPWLAQEVAGLADYFGCSVQDLYDGVVRVQSATVNNKERKDLTGGPTPQVINARKCAALATVVPLTWRNTTSPGRWNTTCGITQKSGLHAPSGA